MQAAACQTPLALLILTCCAVFLCVFAPIGPRPHGGSCLLPVLLPCSAPAGPTLAQVATHASESDCWVAINGKVRCSPCAVRPAGARHVLAPCCRCMRCAQRELQAVAPHPPTSAHTLSAPAPRVTLQVYDLTAWLPQHPGEAGSSPSWRRIFMCMPPWQPSALRAHRNPTVAPPHPLPPQHALTPDASSSPSPWLLPAGGVAILAVHCGTDATAPFTMQHGQSGEPQETLPSYFVADLSA